MKIPMKIELLALILFVAVPVMAQTVAIRAGHVIDTAAGAVTKDQIIVVEGGKVKSIGSNVGVPKDAQVVDLSSEWLTPGLIDAHTHITMTEVPGKAPFEALYLKESSAFRALRGLKNAQEMLQAGFTAMRDVGNEANYACEDVRKAVQKKWFEGPTILCAGKIIGPFGGQSKGMPEEQGTFWRWEYLDADTPDEIRKAIHENIYYGADVIKLASDNSEFFYTEEEIRAAVEESHNAGRAVAVHVYGGKAADNVIRGGADSIEHGFALTDTQLQMMKEKGTFLVGTDFPTAHLILLNPSNETLADSKKLGDAIIDRLRRANKIGVKMAFGSDTVSDIEGRTRADMMLDYLAVWRAADVSPAGILKSMTTNGAELLRIDKQRGSIAAGLSADIVAMPSNPLEDIESLRKVNFVMKDGKIVRSAK